MTLTWRDTAAGMFTLLAVAVYAASREGWNVALVGSSHRWAAGAILILGMASCNLGTAGPTMMERLTTVILAVVGTLALAFAIWALWTGSLTALTLLVVTDALLWFGSTLRHASEQPRHRVRPV